MHMSVVATGPRGWTQLGDAPPTRQGGLDSSGSEKDPKQRGLRRSHLIHLVDEDGALLDKDPKQRGLRPLVTCPAMIRTGAAPVGRSAESGYRQVPELLES